MTDKTVRGRFVWHELMTPDTSAAHSFYSKTLGWKTQTSDQVPDYSMFLANSAPLGGTVALPAGTPHWLAYIGTPDIEASVEQAKELGAKVVRDVEEIPNMGKFAVLNDPQGATFALYTSNGDVGREKPPKRGEFSWHELSTTDAKAALDFYSELFGWEKRAAHDMGPMGMYYLFGRNGQEIGGMCDKPADEPGGPSWLNYVRVKDLEQTVKKVKSAGGTLTTPPMEVPGGDWIAHCVDPHGAAFAVHTLKADMAAAQPKEETPAEAEAEEPATTAEEPAPAAAPPAKPKAKSKAKSKKTAKPAAVAKSTKKAAAKSAGKKKAAPAKAAKGAKSAKASKAAKAPAKKAAAAKLTKGTKGGTKGGAKATRAGKKPARKK